MNAPKPSNSLFGLRPLRVSRSSLDKFTRAAALSAVAVFGLASAAAGGFDLIWGNFEPAHQPIQALGDRIPGRMLLAYLAGLSLISAGVGLQFRRTAHAAALTLALVYLAFALFWLPRFYTAPHALGFRLPVIIGLVGGIAMQLILVAAAVILYAAFSPHGSKPLHPAIRISRWVCGLASASFGLVHLTNVPGTARMIPKWLPLSAEFWTVFTGIAFVLAGLAILSRIQDVLAARLLALMLLLFDLLVLAPLPFHSPHNHVAWGSNAYNMAAVGAFWIFAEYFARPHPRYT
jgi:uncharacterized membrane protein